MKKILCIFMLLPTLALAQPNESIKEALTPWSPLSIETIKGKITIVLDEKRITDKIFTGVIKNGICMPLWLGDTNALDGITGVTVLNKFSHQGYDFEGGKDLCDEMGKLPSDKSEIVLLGNSKIHTRNK